MSPDSVFWLGRAWCTLPAISIKVKESLLQIPAQGTTYDRKQGRYGEIAQ